MKNKNGFTLVELLAVIVILGVLTAIAVPSVIGISNKIKQDMLYTKGKTIETAAELYAQDSRECDLDITVNDLITKKYLKEDVVDENITGGTSIVNIATSKNTKIDLEKICKSYKKTIADKNYGGNAIFANILSMSISGDKYTEPIYNYQPSCEDTSNHHTSTDTLYFDAFDQYTRNGDPQYKLPNELTISGQKKTVSNYKLSNDVSFYFSNIDDSGLTECSPITSRYGCYLNVHKVDRGNDTLRVIFTDNSEISVKLVNFTRGISLSTTGSFSNSSKGFVTTLAPYYTGDYDVRLTAKLNGTDITNQINNSSHVESGTEYSYVINIGLTQSAKTGDRLNLCAKVHIKDYDDIKSLYDYTDKNYFEECHDYTLN